MSVRVNLLPREFEAHARQRRVVTFTIIGVLLFAAALGALYFVKQGSVDQARTVRDDAQAEVARLQGEVRQLEEFRQLADQLQARNDLLAFAMETEISWATILNDLALTFPGNASMQTLTATLTGAQPAAPGDVTFGTAVANLLFTGYSLEFYAPGVEGVLLEFEKVRSFFNPYIATAAREELETIGETVNFTGSVELDENAYTRRYADGLPAEVAR
jgi:hypothetical protein